MEGHGYESIYSALDTSMSARSSVCRHSHLIHISALIYSPSAHSKGVL